MKKSIIIPILAMTTLMSCGGGNSTTQTSSDTTQTSTTASAPDEYTDKDAQPEYEEDEYQRFDTGDLNGDGIKDSVVFDMDFLVYFGDKDGKYTLFKKYKVWYPESDDNRYSTLPDITDKGQLKLTASYQGDGWETNIYTLKFKDDDFELLDLINESGLDGYTTYIYNFVDKTMLEDIYEGEGEHYKGSFSLKNLPLPKLSEFTINRECNFFDDKYLIPNSRKDVKP